MDEKEADFRGETEVDTTRRDVVRIEVVEISVCSGLCEESLIWIEGMPVVVGDELTAAGFFVVERYFTAKKASFTTSQ